ncbi:NADH-cytochrome b5 reductase [Boothiomyces macroporosus]|uniref:NADH-cytochrome b5 reductase n=1 Tax=Boothiomyces macroporosus TaxID=261099 RepID=A0AAD5UNT8_9FUNG|nr:NADH-cytochrome b5 reductase [Boothiomyces macroporosus]
MRFNQSQVNLPTPTNQNPNRQVDKDELWEEDPEYDKVITGFVIFGVVVCASLYYYLKSQPKINTLLPNEFTDNQVTKVQQVNHDTWLYQVYSQSGIEEFDVPFHVVIKDDTCQIGRQYTPISRTSSHLTFLIKLYKDGSLSRMFRELKVGDVVSMRGPILTMPAYVKNSCKEIGMVCAGTGITPMYQLIKKILQDPVDQTKITLFYQNKTVADILLKAELDHLRQTYPDQLKIVYSVDHGYADRSGYVDLKALKILPKECVLVCGPDGFVGAVAGRMGENNTQGPVGGFLKELGYTSTQVYKL